MTVEKYAFCRSTPLYRPALDTIVRGARRDGRGVRARLARSADRRRRARARRGPSRPPASGSRPGGLPGGPADRRGRSGGSEVLIAAERGEPGGERALRLARPRGQARIVAYAATAAGLAAGSAPEGRPGRRGRRSCTRTTKIGNPPGIHWSTVWTRPENAALDRVHRVLEQRCRSTVRCRRRSRPWPQCRPVVKP